MRDMEKNMNVIEVVASFRQLAAVVYTYKPTEVGRK